MVFKNLLLTASVKALRRFLKIHPKTESRRFLIVTTTALGDTLWATPAIESLKQSFPKAYIAALTSPIGNQVLQHNPWLSKIYTLHRFTLSLWKQLYQEQFDTILLFHASQRLILPLCALLGAREIIGTSGINKGLDHLLTDRIAPAYEHEICRRLKIVEKSKGFITTQTLSFFLQPEETWPTIPKAPKKQWIALHPGSKDPFKRWPIQNFIQLGNRLKDSLNCEILITGTEKETSLLKQLTQQIPGAHMADPQLPLRSFASLIDSIDLLICNDTGPFHLACALNTPVLGIYSSTDPNLCGAHLAPCSLVIHQQPSCKPCLKRKCLIPFCFLQIGIDEVFQAVLKMLDQTQ